MIILLYTVEFAISHVNWFSEYRDISSSRSRNSWKSLTNQLALRMGQVVVLPLVFINQSMPSPLPRIVGSIQRDCKRSNSRASVFAAANASCSRWHSGHGMFVDRRCVPGFDLDRTVPKFASSHSPPSSILRSDGGIGRVFCGDQRGFLGAWRFSFGSSRRIASFGNRQQDNPKSDHPR